MTWAGRSRSRSLALPVSARTRRTSPGGNALAITPRLMWSLTRMPAGRPAGMRAIVAARPRTSASMAQPCSYVNRIGVKGGHRLLEYHRDPPAADVGDRPLRQPQQVAAVELDRAAHD